MIASLFHGAWTTSFSTWLDDSRPGRIKQTSPYLDYDRSWRLQQSRYSKGLDSGDGGCY
jgi:hypothetical protein